MNKLLEYVYEIEDTTIRRMACLAIEIIPEYFWKVPASSSGKYHPSFSVKEGGLLNHTTFGLDLIKDLSNISIKIQKFKDKATLAYMLHDTFKYGDTNEGSKHTNKLHPKIASEKYRYLWEENGFPEELINEICNAIESHMGQWDFGGKLRSPETDLDRFVHLVDYIASRKFLDKYW